MRPAPFFMRRDDDENRTSDRKAEADVAVQKHKTLKQKVNYLLRGKEGFVCRLEHARNPSF